MAPRLKAEDDEQREAEDEEPQAANVCRVPWAAPALQGSQRATLQPRVADDVKAAG